MLYKLLIVKILMCGSTDVIILVLFIDNIVESFCNHKMILNLFS